MNRKDCDNFTTRRLRNVLGGVPARGNPTGTATLAHWICLPAIFACCEWAQAGAVRVWPTAVVVADSIRLDDIAIITGTDEATLERLSGLLVAEAPPPGGSRVLHLGAIRNALSQSGANLALLTISGATECEVVRPNVMVVPPPSASDVDPSKRTPTARDDRASSTAFPAEPTAGARAEVSPRFPAIDQETTLCRAVIDYLNGELARYGGTAEVTFDHTSRQVLDLSGTSYRFRVRRTGGPTLGLIPLEVDVEADGQTLQTIPLVVQTAMVRRVVVAARSINQGATIGAADVELLALRFHDFDHLGLDDVALAIGQRARRAVSTGSVIEPDVLEEVPLVVRGQLVRVASREGAIEVVTAAKAAQDGFIDDVIKVRSADDKRIEFDAVVCAPGEVRVGLPPPVRRDAMAAGGVDP